MGGVSCWGPPGLDLPGDDPQVWPSQGRATHTSQSSSQHPRIWGMAPFSGNVGEKTQRGEVSGGWLMVITTKRLVSEENRS